MKAHGCTTTKPLDCHRILMSVEFFNSFSIRLPAAFTVEITQADIPGLEGSQLQVTVRLEGQTFGEVDVELQLLTLSEFQSRPEAPQGYTLSKDLAECKVAVLSRTCQHTGFCLMCS